MGGSSSSRSDGPEDPRLPGSPGGGLEEAWKEGWDEVVDEALWGDVEDSEL